MDGPTLIALSIPIFFALIGVELIVARLQGHQLYRLNDSVNDLSCGILQQVLGVFVKVVVFGSYVALYETFHLFAMPEAPDAPWWVWALCFLGVDFFYYWFHRVSHEVNLPWGAHIVHHSSEEYNLTVALRQGSFQQFFSFLFYLPLAVLGFPPLVFLTCSSLNTLYQFWIHTRAIGKLGPFEWIFNTPSHHRVHHGCDEKYLDRNYAGTLIIWDRLFGTFQEEEEEPTYGVTKPLASWNPLWANLHYYADLIRAGRQAPNLREKIRLWFLAPADKPEWAEAGLGAADGPTPLSHGEEGKYDAEVAPGLLLYVLLHFLGVLAMTVLLLYRADDLGTWGSLALAMMIAWSTADVGALFDGRRWVLPSELMRLATLWAVGVWWSGSFGTSAQAWTAGLGILLTGFFAAWLMRHRTSLRPA